MKQFILVNSRNMHHRMYRIFRTIQTPTCRRFSTRENPFTNRSRIPKSLSKVAPVGAAAFMLGGAILFKNKNANAQQMLSLTDENSETKIDQITNEIRIKEVIISCSHGYLLIDLYKDNARIVLTCLEV